MAAHTNTQSHSAAEPGGFSAPDAGALPSTSPAKILIIDTVPANRQAVREALADFNYELLEPENTSEAIAALSLYRVDLVIVGVSAPDIGGLEFCRMLKKASATRFVPIFVTSPIDDPDREVAALEAGADAFLLSPIRSRVFRARVEASLRQKAIIDSLDDSETVLFSLAQSVEERDPGLGQHCQRLALMAAAMGVALGLSGEDIYTLQRGGYLHDIGKIAIPDKILFKRAPLTREEWEIMKSHTVRGERICSSTRSLAPVLPIIRHHHERWNGTGYPDGLRGEEIPLFARILQLPDIYDALTTPRPYKPALTADQALALIREEAKRGWRDPQLVELFSDIIPSFHTPSPPDLSQISLHALAESIERYRRKAQPKDNIREIIKNKARTV
jgi:putative two-component system response regulator